MTRSALNTSAFLEKLIAPLPAGEERADTPKFRKAIVRDMYQVWSAGMDHVELADALHIAACRTERINAVPGEYPYSALANPHFAYEKVIRARRAQCLIPSPTMKEVRWKRKMLKALSGDAIVSRAIAADEARLGSAA